ncbi:cysteine hydrolase family protein [Enterobacter ludwigii]|uniref:Isochorismatase n=1 Tax=Enterobacter roggenkampii TaxID=1812935 RepID=A0A837LE57_9ENTR|nr:MULTISPECIES: cysteine hydrolase family protein [Enterobacteriaceae]EDU1513697.1 cysteine hydrolase [Salmonella enterica subsp. enterica serovar Liverpool]EGL2796185.1 cysteine hydrolase [Salmonella enterica]ELA1562111.1 cysteine hydrolase [Klebsiella pneumoniae]PYZ20976.1 cysteine hydrolase [Enterobacter cloacae complex sp.]HAL0492505.1 cysteine hydrolase [Escherichia coli]HDK6616687.1 cysteine hydrolase [Klebsiella variicola]
MKQRGLIVIDLQNEYLPTGKLPLTGIEAAAHNAARAIADARSKNIPVFHIRHEFANNEAPVFIPGSDGVEIQDTVTPAAGEAVIVKNFINSFRETDLKAQLDAKGVEEVIIVGAMSHMCVDACVRAAADMGYPVTVLHDACATLDLTFGGVNVPAAQVHAAMMAAFEFGYGKVQSTADYLSA